MTLFLTRQERLCLWFLCALLWTGHLLHFCWIRYPSLQRIMSFMEEKHLSYKVDVNHAGYEELVRIPYIGDFTARKILKRRRDIGRFRSLAEISSIPGIYPKNSAKFLPYLKVGNE